MAYKIPRYFTDRNGQKAVTNSIIMLLLLLNFPLLTQAHACADTLHLPFRDTAYIDNLNAQAKNHYLKNQLKIAKTTADRALHLSKKEDYLTGEAMSHHILGSIFRVSGNHNEALKHYFNAIQGYEIMGGNLGTITVKAEIGILYQRQKAYLQSIKYFEEALKKSEETGHDDQLKASLIENIAHSYKQAEDYKNAQRYYRKAEAIHRKSKNLKKTIAICNEISLLSQSNEQYRSAQKYNMELVSLYEKTNDLIGLSSAYNNLGVILKRTKELKASYSYFNKVTELLKKQPDNLSEDDLSTLLVNIGVAYTNMKSYTRAKESYEQALKIQEKHRNPIEIANINNYMAGSHYVSGNNTQALKTVMRAIEIAEPLNAEHLLMTSYRIMHMIYQQEGNHSKAEKYLNMHSTLKAKIDAENEAKKQKMLRKQLEIEQEEEEIRTLLAEQERSTMEAERKQNELVIREKELAILKRDQELREAAYKNQQLEKERTEQALALARQQLDTEKKNRKMATLEKEKELQSLALKQKELEDEKQKKAIALLQTKEKLQNETILKEESKRKFTYGLLALSVMILAVIVSSFLQKKRDNEKLKEKQGEISAKNAKLKQNMEELKTAQESLNEQKNQLELQHQKITHSIRYAQRIQSSILPTDNLMSDLFPERFLIYKPKDIVSGDFYWMSNKDNKKIISVVDCTGHGVPGSLMSIVGSNTLNELINQRGITDPAMILCKLHEQIREKLSQEESKNHDGMDLGLCTLENTDDKKIKLTYAGAKHTLYIVKSSKLQEINGDRKSIGGANSSSCHQYTNQEIYLDQGDLLYLTTDGFIDQNDKERKSFNKKRFRTLIEEIKHLNLHAQQASFEKALALHQQDAEQRDDITLLGVRI